MAKTETDQWGLKCVVPLRVSPDFWYLYPDLPFHYAYGSLHGLLRTMPCLPGSPPPPAFSKLPLVFPPQRVSPLSAPLWLDGKTPMDFQLEASTLRRDLPGRQAHSWVVSPVGRQVPPFWQGEGLQGT